MNDGMITMGDGCQISWEASGRKESPALILSNSLGTDRDMWLPQLSALCDHFRVIRYDTRGHGRSDVFPGGYSIDRLGRDVVELADALDLEKFSFCGLSLGGMTGQWLGVRAPERLHRLVIANSSPYMGPPSGWDRRIQTVLGDGMGAIRDGVIARWFTEPFRGAKHQAIQSIVDMLMATKPQGYAGCCAAIRDMDLRRLIGLIDVPTLVIGGSQDEATPPSDTKLLADGISGAQCVMLKAAHLANTELPDEFQQALLSFLV